MDNDRKLIKQLKELYKKLKFKKEYEGIQIVDANGGNHKIKDIVMSGTPAMIARCGATEMRCVDEYYSSGRFSDKIKREIQELSGVFPTDNGTLKKFCEYYIKCIEKADILALWGVGAESKVVKNKCKMTIFTELTALEPYYFSSPWSVALKGKKVLVIHPFKQSIESQYKKRKKIFQDPHILPEFASLTCIKAIQSSAGEKTEYKSWFDALDFMFCEIDRTDFDVAIIGAGAYSLPIAAYIKEKGKVAIQMSGSTQILFGIIGRRWESIPGVSGFFNDNWVRPSESETPKQSQKVEGGSYW